MNQAIISNIITILDEISTRLADLDIFISLLTEEIAMSDFEKICETQNMINNQHNIMSERLRELENRAITTQTTVAKIMVKLDEISKRINDNLTRTENNEITDSSRYSAITNQIKTISDSVNAIKREMKLYRGDKP